MRNLEVVRGIYRAMAQGDVSAMFERFAPDCVVAQDPRLPWGGRWQGHDGLVEFALPLVGLIDSQVHTDAIYESDDEHVVEFGHTVGATGSTARPSTCTRCTSGGYVTAWSPMPTSPSTANA
jgi:ketosteroid isomerase-like protein